MREGGLFSVLLFKLVKFSYVMKKRGWGTILGASQGRAQRFDNIFLPHEFRGFLLV